MEAVRRGTGEPKRWDKGSVHLALLHQQVLWSIIISLRTARGTDYLGGLEWMWCWRFLVLGTQRSPKPHRC